MKFAICNEVFSDWDFQRVVKFVKEAGYDGIEIAPFTLADSVTEISAPRRRELKRMAADAGLEITGLHWLLVKPEGLHISHPDPTIRSRTVDYLCRLMEFSADLGGKILTFGCPKQRTVLPEATLKEAWKWALETFLACGETAEKHGVILCLEALPSRDTNFLNTNAQVLAFVKEANHPNIRMMLDVKSMCAEDIPVPENIRSCNGFFHHVHANDSNLRAPGFGEVDFRPIFSTLAEVGYDGYVSVEPFDYSPDPETLAVKTLEYMKDCLYEVLA